MYLGFGSANLSAEAAFLGSCAWALHDVSTCLGVSTWEGFCAKCVPLTAKMQEAEAKLLRDAGGRRVLGQASENLVFQAASILGATFQAQPR